MQAFCNLKASEVLVPKPLIVNDKLGFCDVREAYLAFDEPLLNEALLASDMLALPIGRHAGHTKSVVQLRQRVETESVSECAYRIEIEPDSILCESSSAEGIWYAVQILRQLFATFETLIPCSTICDGPSYAWRGFMLDTARHFFTVEFIKKLLDLAAQHRLNRFHWHLTDDQGWTIPVKDYPKLVHRNSSSYSNEEIREIIAFASARHIEVIAEIDMPGHMLGALSAYPAFGCTKGPYSIATDGGIFEDVLCMGNDDAITFAKTVIREVAELFPSRYIHIGGDECPTVRWQECSLCKARMKDLHIASSSGLQRWFTNEMIRVATDSKKIPICWDDVSDTEEHKRVSKQCIVMVWRNSESALRLAKEGYQVVMCPKLDGCYLDYRHLDTPEEPGTIGVNTVRSSYEFSIPEGNRNLMLGGQANVWTEKICSEKRAEYMLFPRLCAISEALWLPKHKKNFVDFTSRLEIHTRRLIKQGVNVYRGPLQ